MFIIYFVLKEKQTNTELPAVAAKETTVVDSIDDTERPLAVDVLATTVSTPAKEEKQQNLYMCLIYCHCGCIESHCCSGCKECSKEQLSQLFLSNMNPSENSSLSAETTTSPPS